MLSVQNVVTKAVTDDALSLAGHVSSELWMRVDSLPLSYSPCEEVKKRMFKYIVSYSQGEKLIEGPEKIRKQ